MLTLSRKTDYALIALSHLVHEPDGCTSAREIAGRYNVPLPLLMNILKQLTQKGLARSVRGPRGGYKLALPANRISLNDIIHAVEGPVHLVQCIEKHDGERQGDCDLASCCPVRSPIHRIHDRLVGFLSGVTLADIVENGNGCDQVQAPPAQAGTQFVRISGT
jgi:Rrf2 family protein